MTEINEDLAIAQIKSLMTSYSFDTNQYSVKQIVQQWQRNYHVHWIYLATIEALYLGRYKAISVEQIMNGWLRRGQPNTHFTGDFERVICRKLPRHLNTVNSTNHESFPQQIFDGESKLQSSITDRSFAVKDDRDRTSSQLNNNVTSDEADGNHNFQQPIISTKVTPVPQHRTISPPNQLKTPNQKNHHNQSLSKGIVTFQPDPDASGFFQKFKALADNQRKKEEE